MFRAAIILTICDSLCSFHGFTDASSRHNAQVKRPHDLANRRPMNGLEREPFDYEYPQIVFQRGPFDYEYPQIPFQREPFDYEYPQRVSQREPFDYEYPQPLSHRRVSRKHKEVVGGRGLISDLFKGAAGVAKKVAVGALRTGHKLIMPPLKGVEWVTGKVSKIFAGNMKLLKSIAGSAKDALKGIRAIEFPGKSIVGLILPVRGIVAIVDKVTNDVMHIATATKDAVKATLAYSVYAALKVIFGAVTTAVKTLGFACISLPEAKLEPSIGLVNTVEIGGGTVCGLDSLHPKNNITITRDDGKLLDVKMPWAFNNLKVNIGSVDVSGWMGPIVKSQPLEAAIKEIALQGTISLQRGTILRFLSLHLEMGEISGINIKVVGAEGGVAAGVINSLAGALGGLVQNLVNEHLTEMEKQISEQLLGSSRRRRK